MKIADNVIVSTSSKFSDEIPGEQRQGGAIFLEYNKGDETDLRVQVQYSHTEDDPEAENWHTLVEPDPAAQPDAKPMKSVVFVFDASGKFRFQIPGVPGDDRMRLEFFASGAPSSPGNVTIHAEV